MAKPKRTAEPAEVEKLAGEGLTEKLSRLADADASADGGGD